MFCMLPRISWILPLVVLNCPHISATRGWLDGQIELVWMEEPMRQKISAPGPLYGRGSTKGDNQEEREPRFTSAWPFCSEEMSGERTDLPGLSTGAGGDSHPLLVQWTVQSQGWRNCLVQFTHYIRITHSFIHPLLNWFIHSASSE